MKKTLIGAINDPEMAKAAKWVIQTGGLIIFPTDTVFGIACDPWKEKAIQAIYEVKQRAPEKAIPILIGEITQLASVTASISPRAAHLARTFWPGALTLLLPKHESLPGLISAYPSVGIRMPDHAALCDLLMATGPLATTSANLSGSANLTVFSEIIDQFKGKVELILDDGAEKNETASTVVDCSGDEPVIVREGPISREAIIRAWKGS